MKAKKVTLEAGDLKQEFDFIHAEKILKHVSNSRPNGWRLPNDSKFEFKNNELRTKSNKGSNKATKV